MDKEAPNKIAAIRKRRNLTQQQLGDAVGAHWITISKLERGLLPLTYEWADKLALALKVDDTELSADRPARATIFVDSLIKDGRLIGMEADEPYPVTIDTAQIDTGNSIWGFVSDNSLYPHFQLGDLLRLIVTVEDPKKFIGRLCMVRPTDEARSYICYLEQGRTAGTFTANRLASPPLVDIKIEYFALIERAIFQPRLTKEIKAEIAKANKL